jgi:murein L,D-transpeptidase YcbB/YkuD
MSALVPCLCLLLTIGSAQAPSLPEALRSRIEQLHDAPATRVRNARLLRPDAVAHFFQERNFQPAWEGQRARAIVDAIRDIGHDGLNPRDYHFGVLEAALASNPSTPAERADVEILLTDALAALIDHVRFGKVRPVTLDRRWNVDPREGTPPLEIFVAQVASASSVAQAIEGVKPSHFIYRGLKGQLAARRGDAARGGWPTVPPGAPLKPGVSDPRVQALRARLAASGELPSADGGPQYDDALVAAVKRFQEHHRLTPDGIIGAATLAALNVSAAARVDQVRVNLERARWVVSGLSDSFVLVNLPAFKTYVIRDRKNVWETRAQVGRSGRQTPTFRADMQYLVFNPDWTVPPTIAAQDVIAPMKKGVNAIARKNLMILDRQGRRVSPDAIDWANASRANFPYTLRQAPGPGNALGRVKFIFPNEHSIFLHDTPSQELFSADERLFSSGCIRVENPLDLAAVLLAGQDEWDRASVQRAVDSGRTETVFLKTPMQVLIVYWTVSVGASGESRYARDIYNLDGRLLKALDAITNH